MGGQQPTSCRYGWNVAQIPRLATSRSVAIKPIRKQYQERAHASPPQPPPAAHRHFQTARRAAGVGGKDQTPLVSSLSHSIAFIEPLLQRQTLPTSTHQSRGGGVGRGHRGCLWLLQAVGGGTQQAKKMRATAETGDGKAIDLKNRALASVRQDNRIWRPGDGSHHPSDNISTIVLVDVESSIMSPAIQILHVHVPLKLAIAFSASLLNSKSPPIISLSLSLSLSLCKKVKSTPDQLDSEDKHK